MTILVLLIGMFQVACGNVKDSKMEVTSTDSVVELIEDVAEVQEDSMPSLVAGEEEVKQEAIIQKEAKPKEQISPSVEMQEEKPEEKTVTEHVAVEEEVRAVETLGSIAKEEVAEVQDTKVVIPSEVPAVEPFIEEEVEIITVKPDHSALNGLLSKYVDSKGNVDYAGLKTMESQLDAYLADLSANSVASSWSRSEKLAYWINAYNAFTLKLIIKNYPLSSITKLHGGKPWDEKWIKIGDKTYSLNQIENEIIRPEFNEPRIHFAVNCAAKSCPPLANKAFTAGNLDALLESQTRAFISNSGFNQIASDKVKVSKIFDWYGKDFGNLIGFLNKYSATKISESAKVEFSEYDWALNKK